MVVRIRPEDTEERRAVVILRHVPDTAPRMTIEELAELREVIFNLFAYLIFQIVSVGYHGGLA